MVTLYKLTDAEGWTRRSEPNALLWAPGVTHEAQGEKLELCTDGLIHAYEHPLLAVLLNPIHANYSPAKLWRCETSSIPVREGQLKCGVRRLTCVEEMPLPEVSAAQRTRLAILCAWEVCENDEWREWATNWLSEKDRSEAAARAAAEARVCWAAVAAADAAARARAWAFLAAEAAMARAADAAAKVAAKELNLIAIAERAIAEEG